MVIKWKKRYALGLDEIDHQHRAIVSLMGKLELAIADEAPMRELRSVLRDLLKISQVHFSTEERYFVKFAYEGRFWHMKEHRKFENKIKDYLSMKKRKKVDAGLSVMLYEWFVEHMLEDDRKYVKLFRKLGVK